MESALHCTRCAVDPPSIKVGSSSTTAGTGAQEGAGVSISDALSTDEADAVNLITTPHIDYEVRAPQTTHPGATAGRKPYFSPRILCVTSLTYSPHSRRLSMRHRCCSRPARVVLGESTVVLGGSTAYGGARTFYVLRRFTKLLPNARDVSNERDHAALKSIFKASGGTKAAAGVGIGVPGPRTVVGRPTALYFDGPNPGSCSVRSGCLCADRGIRPTGRAHGIVTPATPTPGATT